jgi:hypothetical protein
MNSLDKKFAELEAAAIRLSKALVRNSHKRTVKAYLKYRSIKRERDTWLEQNLTRI